MFDTEIEHAPGHPPHRFVTILTDGASKGNTLGSPASIGVIIKNEHGDVIDKWSQLLPHTDAIHAEYTALLTGLKRAREIHGATHVVALADSLNMVRHINKLPNEYYKNPPPSIVNLHNQITAEAHGLEDFHLAHVFREYNTEADSAANEAFRESKIMQQYDDAMA